MRRFLSALKRMLKGRARPAAKPQSASDEARALCDRLIQQAAGLSGQEKLRLRNELSQVEELDYARHPIRLHIDSAFETKMRTRSCAKEPGTIAWLEEYVRPGDVLYDIGANIGAYSLVAAKATGNQARIFSFEPSYLNFYQLCRNIVLNRCESSITPVFVPLCRTTGPDVMYYQNADLGGALHSFGRPVDYRAQTFTPVLSLGTLGFSLDDLVRHGKLPLPNHIKLDVDGLEQDILEGGLDVLRSDTLRSLLVELNEELAEECDAIMGVLHNAGLVPLGKYELTAPLFNFIWVRAERAGAPRPTASDIRVIGKRATYKRARAG